MHLKKVVIIILLICISANHVSAGDEQWINEALKSQSVVQLQPGTYYLDDYVKVNSGNSLIGYGVILKVRQTSSQWFTGMTGLVCSQGPVNDVLIEGIEIDGSCSELNTEMANTPGHEHDCERGIIINGDTDKFCKNILIKNVKVYNTFSDGVHIRMAENVQVLNSFFSNCQHSSIFYVSVVNGLVDNNQVAGISSDCLRFDNCVNNVFRNNLLYSYMGDDSNGQYVGGENGVQISDAGSSKGFNAVNKPTTTQNIEGYNNVFANSFRPVWIDSSGRGVENVYLHDNKFLSGSEIETFGIPVRDISFTNPPTKEMSEKIFSNIFDIFSINFYTQIGKNDTVVLPEGVNSPHSETPWTVEQHDLKANSYTLVYGSTDGLSMAKCKVGANETTHILMIGEKRGNNVIFSNASMWKGTISHQGDAFYLDGIVQPEDIQITCISPTDSFKPIIEVKKIENPKSLFNPLFFAIVIFLAPWICLGYFVITRYFNFR